VELPNLTEALYLARERAMDSMQQMGLGLHADGVVNVKLREGPLGHNPRIIQFVAVGTAVKLADSGHRSVEPMMVVPLDDPYSRSRPRACEPSRAAEARFRPLLAGPVSTLWPSQRTEKGGHRVVRQDREAAEGVALVTLDRPERMNAMAFDVMIPLRESLQALGRDNTVRVVVLTGAGHGFCSGADLEDPGALPNIEGLGLPTIALRSMELLDEVIRTLRRLHQPVIAAVNGAAIGGGFCLAMRATSGWPASLPTSGRRASTTDSPRVSSG